MNTIQRTLFAVCLVGLAASSASGQQANPKFSSYLAKMEALNRRIEGPFSRLSTAAQSYFRQAEALNNPGGFFDAGEEEGEAGEGGIVMGGTFTRKPVPISGATGLKANSQAAPSLISSRALDFQTSRFLGFVQNDSASAWCGNNVVVGYTDLAATWARNYEISQGSFDLPNIGSGVAYSADSGATFKTLPYLNSGHRALTGVVGTPSLACSDPNNFYYASFYGEVTDDFQLRFGVGLNISHDGGKTWTEPIVPIGYTSGFEFADFPHIAIDPSNPKRIAIAYAHIDGTWDNSFCGFDLHFSIGMVRSEDGGLTWSSPTYFNDVCNASGEFVTAPQVAFNKSGTMYVAWLHAFADGSEQIYLRSSFDHGASFGEQQTVTAVVPAGNTGYMQGLLLSNEFPTLAVDNSNGPTSGTIYVGWTDGRFRQIPDAIGEHKYKFGDAAFVKSTDGGATWSPVKTPYSGYSSSDRYMASLAVDRSGAVALCYYDRSADPQNVAFDRICSVSKDGGNNFHSFKLNDHSWIFTHMLTIDLSGAVVTDYDRMTSDVTGQHTGFFAPYVMQTDANTDVYGRRIQ